SERDREVFQVIYNRSRAQATSDPQKLFFENIGAIRRLSQMNPTHIEQACGMFATSGALFSFSGVSFPISRRFLDIAQSLVREGDVRDEFALQAMRFINRLLEGDWREEIAIDDSLVEA